MSSNRANASARQRRAGEPVVQQQNQRMQPGGRPGMIEQQVPFNPKLSVSDAIALITLRLGRVETIVSNLPNDRGDGEGTVSGGQVYDENMRMVDQNVFNSIVSRLDTLEKNQKLLIEKQRTTLPPTVQSVAPIQQTIQETIVKDVSDEKIEPVMGMIDVLKGEVTLLKDLLIKLQNFTMETNKKLVDIVFDDNIPQMFNNSFMFQGGQIGENQCDESDEDASNDGITLLENNDDDSTSVPSLNLKDLIKKELMSEEVLEVVDNM